MVPDGGSAPRATGSLRAFRLGRARQLPSSVRSTSSRNVSQGKGVMSIRIFYHLFLVNEWRHVFEFHLKQMRRSGLYDACDQVHVGAVYDDDRALSELDSLLPGNGKTTLHFARALEAPPTIWRDPEVRLADGRVGEGETILSMTEHARQRDAADIYLFLHSKGVTRPPTKRRRHLSYFVGRGFDPSGSNDAANAFVLEDTATVVTNWREYVEALETTSSFWYYIYNFFWVSGDLLRQFDFDEYMRLHRDLAPPQQRPHRLGSDWKKTRHLFSLFPIKLHAFRNGLELDAPPYTYVNVSL